MGNIRKAVTDKNYRKALELQAVRLAGLLEDENLDDKQAANIARELRITLERLGIDVNNDQDFAGRLLAEM